MVRPATGAHWAQHGDAGWAEIRRDDTLWLADAPPEDAVERDALVAVMPR